MRNPEDAFKYIKAEWLEQVQERQSQPWMKRLATGDVQLCHYLGFLQETYHNAGMNPQLQAYATLYFRNNPRAVIGRFYKHAISEIGHDLLALSDLEVLGVSKDSIVSSPPLPTTMSFFSYFYYQIQFQGPLSYLGYLFHLEFLPTTNGEGYMKNLMDKGVPKNALTFLHEHATVDIGHNKLMEGYVKDLVRTKEDLDIVIDSVKAAAVLHSNLLAGSFENGERLYGKRNSKAS